MPGWSVTQRHRVIGNEKMRPWRSTPGAEQGINPAAKEEESEKDAETNSIATHPVLVQLLVSGCINR